MKIFDYICEWCGWTCWDCTCRRYQAHAADKLSREILAGATVNIAKRPYVGQGGAG